MDNELVELTLCTLIAAAGLLHAARRHGRGEAVCLADAAGWATALSFGIGPWLAFVYAGGSLPRVRNDVLMLAYGCVALHMFGLFLVAAVWRARLSRTGRVAGPSRPRTLGDFFRAAPQVSAGTVFAALAVVWVVRVVLAVKYGMLVSGSARADRVLALPYVMVILGSVSVAFATGIWLWTPATVLARARLRWVALALFLAECAFQFLGGRRMLVALLFCGFAAHLARARALRFVHVATGAVVVALLLQVAFPAFLALRRAHEVLDSRDAIENLRAAIVSTRETGSRAEEAAFRRNMETRPLIIRWNCELVKRQEVRRPMGGKAITSTVAWVVPWVFLPEKRSWADPEETIALHYGMPASDYASNWAAYGYADFGLFGGAFTGILLGLLLFAMQAFAAKVWSWAPLLALVAVGSGFVTAFLVNESPTAPWGILRILLLLAAGAACLRLCVNVARASRIYLPEPGVPLWMRGPGDNGTTEGWPRRG